MGVRQRGDASSYGLRSPCYGGLALGALNAWTHHLLNVSKRVGSENALNHWTNIVCATTALEIKLEFELDSKAMFEVMGPWTHTFYP